MRVTKLVLNIIVLVIFHRVVIGNEAFLSVEKLTLQKEYVVSTENWTYSQYGKRNIL